MNAQTTNKAAERANPKINTAKAAEKVNLKTTVTKSNMDQEKAINQLRQEINNLSKTVKEMQRRPNTQEVNVRIPRELFSKVNAYLLDYKKETGK